MILFEGSWGSVPDWLMLGVTAAAVVASIWFGVKGGLDGGRDRALAWDAVEESRKANTTAKQEQAHARVAHKELVEGARRSAAAAESAEKRQRLIDERSTENHRVNWDVIWVGVGNEFVLQLRNHGPHDAHKVIVQVMHKEGFRYDDFELIPADENVLLKTVSSHWLWKGSQVTIWWNSPKGQVHSQEYPVRAYPEGGAFLGYSNHREATRDGDR